MFTDPSKIYTSPKGRKFKVTTVSMIPETEKYGKYHWRVHIKFLDNNERIRLYYDYEDKIYKKEKI